MDSEMKKTLKVAEIAERYRVGAPKVIAWIKSGQLKAVDVSASGKGVKQHYRVFESELEAFEQRRSVCEAESQPRRHRKRRSRVTDGMTRFFT